MATLQKVLAELDPTVPLSEPGTIREFSPDQKREEREALITQIRQIITDLQDFPDFPGSESLDADVREGQELFYPNQLRRVWRLSNRLGTESSSMIDALLHETEIDGDLVPVAAINKTAVQAIEEIETFVRMLHDIKCGEISSKTKERLLKR